MLPLLERTFAHVAGDKAEAFIAVAQNFAKCEGIIFVTARVVCSKTGQRIVLWG